METAEGTTVQSRKYIHRGGRLKSYRFWGERREVAVEVGWGVVRTAGLESTSARFAPVSATHIEFGPDWGMSRLDRGMEPLFKA